MATASDGQEVADEIEAPFKTAYNRFESFMGKVPPKQKGPNDTVKELNRESEEKARKRVADSFKVFGKTQGTVKQGKKPVSRKRAAYKR